VDDDKHILELQDVIYGEGSLLKLFADTYGLHYLVQDVFITIIESSDFQVGATIDPDDAKSDLIFLTTGVYETINRYAINAVNILQSVNQNPWMLFGWKKNDFDNNKSFENYLSRVMLDFILLHELSHIVRGHIKYYLQLTQQAFQEIENVNENRMPALRRITLELDADSVAFYYLITCSGYLIEKSGVYSTARTMSTFIKLIGVASKIVFAVLSEFRPVEKINIPKDQTLISYHKNQSHPHPGIREEFSTQRIMQLARDAKERRAYRRYLDDAYSIFLTLIGNNMFSMLSVQTWQRDPAEVADCINSLIDEMQFTKDTGWIVNDTRLDKAIDAIIKASGNQ
jgi:hypothetical protein